jgi:chromosome segregation ATPase
MSNRTAEVRREVEKMGELSEQATNLQQQLDAANQRILNYESEIGAVCPEDFSLKETIDSFKREISKLQAGRASLLRRAEAAESKLAMLQLAISPSRKGMA